jgi:hypothetical protein
MPGRAMVGVEGIEMGACGTNGLMGTVLTALGLFVPDSVIISFDEITNNPIYVEDFDNSFIDLPSSEGQPKSLTFSSRDVSPTAMKRFFGGDLSGEVWTPPAQIAMLTQSVKVTTRAVGGYKYEYQFTKCTVFASLEGGLKKGDTASMKIRCSVNTPYDANNSPLSWGKLTRIPVS